MAHQRTPQPKKRSSNPPQTSRRSLPTQEQSPSYEGRPSHAEPVAYYSQPVGYYLPYPAMATGDQPPVRSPTPVDGTKGGTVSTQPGALHSLFKPPPTPAFLGPPPIYPGPAFLSACPAIDHRYQPLDAIPQQNLNTVLLELLSRAARASDEEPKGKSRPSARPGGCCRAAFFVATLVLALMAGSLFSFYVVSGKLSEKDLSFFNFTPFAVFGEKENKVAAAPKEEPSSRATTLPTTSDQVPTLASKQDSRVFYLDPKWSTAQEPTEATEKHKVKVPRCRTAFCRDMTDRFKSLLNWTLSPCGDIYEFVCSSWKTQEKGAFSQDSLYAEEIEERLRGSLLESSELENQLLKPAADRQDVTENSTSPLGYAETLIELCMNDNDNKSDSEKQAEQWMHLRSLLTTVGLEKWPYQNDSASRADLWTTVALIYRHLGLPTLAAVSVEKDPENETSLVISIDEPDIAIGLFGTKDVFLPNWYSHAVRGTMKMFSPYKYLSQADKVLAFSEKLAGITSTRGERNYGEETKIATVYYLPSYAQFLGLLFDDITTVNEKTRLLVKNMRYLKALRTLIHMTQNQDLLNYLGFRAILHISPLMFGEQFVELASVRMRQLTGNKKLGWPRWKTCLRMLEEAMPSVFQRAIFTATEKLLNIERVTALLNDLKSSAILAVSNFTWMEAADKIKARNILSDVNFEVFFPSWIREDNGEAFNLLLPAPPNDTAELLSAYSDFVRRKTERRLLAIAGAGVSSYPEWKGSIFATYPKFDYETRSVYVPVALFNFSAPDTDAGLLFQTPRVATRVLTALIASLHRNSYPLPGPPTMLNPTETLASATTCLQSQYRILSNNLHDEKIRSVVTTTYDFLDNVAMEPAVRVFSKYVVESGVAVQQDMLNLPLNSKQLFHVLYTADMCESGSSEQLRQEFAEDAMTHPRLRVMIPLRNTPSFAQAWSCSPEDQMNPSQKCQLLT
uniref:Gluzincin n=1 Tax=Rhipicephalus appendiculatus TaxID=34631 RepID=A0A131Z133_RHIAP